MRTSVTCDRELAEKAKAGDSAAFGELWARHEPHVLALCRRTLQGASPDPAIDEYDLATDTFIRALHYLDRYEDRTAEGASFRAWLLEVAKRVCLRFLAKQRRRQRWSTVLGPEQDLADLPDAAATAEQMAQESDLLRCAAQVVNALPEPYRAAFKLYLEEYSQKEIAAALGISVENAAKRVQRARRQLQPRLAALFDMPAGDSGRQPSLRGVERALTEVVSEHRIVTITLPAGGEMQLCLRVDRALAGRAVETDGALPIEALIRRLERHPRAWKKRLELADLCYYSGRWTEARSYYEATLEINPGCFVAVLRLGDMLRHEQQPEAEARVYRAALAQAPPLALEALLEARLLAAEGQDEEAVSAFRRALALDPREKAGYAGLHRALGRLSRYDEQLANLDQLRALDPDDRLALIGVYTPCAWLRRFDIARPLLERAVALDPNDPMAIKHLFQVRMNLHLYDTETLQWAERLVQIAPQFVASWGELAWIYAELGRDEESLAVLHQFAAEHPHNAEAQAALAWRYHYLGCPAESAVCARRAYALDPGDPYTCWALCVAGKEEESAISEEEALRQAAEIAARFPCDAGLLAAVSGVYLKWGRWAEALDTARRAAALSPASVETQGPLAYVYRAVGRWEEAAAIYHRLAETPGAHGGGYLCAWAEALKALNDPRAEALFAEACDRARSAGEDLACADVYEAWGRRDEAIAAFRRCLSRSPLSTYFRLRAEAGLRRLAPTA